VKQNYSKLEFKSYECVISLLFVENGINKALAPFVDRTSKCHQQSRIRHHVLLQAFNKKTLGLTIFFFTNLAALVIRVETVLQFLHRLVRQRFLD